MRFDGWNSQETLTPQHEPNFFALLQNQKKWREKKEKMDTKDEQK